jgi:hypothetical protein
VWNRAISHNARAAERRSSRKKKQQKEEAVSKQPPSKPTTLLPWNEKIKQKYHEQHQQQK